VPYTDYLIAMARRPTDSVVAVARRRRVRQRSAGFDAIKADAAANIGRRELSAAWIAARHGVSPSHVRRLFADEKVTFSAFVLDYRLARAHAILSDPGTVERTISSIAFALGFGDLSYFNRTFRRQFGARPSDVRAVALGDEAK
jgi:AraC-like DNA-binding protein